MEYSGLLFETLDKNTWKGQREYVNHKWKNSYHGKSKSRKYGDRKWFPEN